MSVKSLLRSSNQCQLRVFASSSTSRCFATKPAEMRRLFDQTLAQDPVKAKEIQAVIADNAQKTVDAHLHFLRFKGRKNNPLALSDLKHIFVNSELPKDIRVVQAGVELYESKGLDFSEEIGSLFIKTCLRLKRPKVAGEMIAKHENRIGAWITPKSLLSLFAAMAEKRQIDLMTTIAETAHKKGINAARSVEVVESLVRAASKGTVVQYDRAINIGTEMLASKPADLDRIKIEFPVPVEYVTPVAEAGAESESESESETKASS